MNENKPSKWGKIPTPFTPRQIRNLFAAIDNPKIALVCFVALRTGMRKMEVLTLKQSEIRWELCQIIKPRTKGGKPRVYYLDKPSIRILEKWCGLLGQSEYVFPSNDRQREHMHPTGFYTEFRKYMVRSGNWLLDPNRAGKKKYLLLNFHSLRTTFCSLLVNNEVDIYTASKLMGHSKVATTAMHYAVLGDKTLKRGLDKVFGAPESLPQPTQTTNIDPLHALKLKLVNGEITPEQFKERAQALQAIGETPVMA